MTSATTAEVKRPSALSPDEVAAWRDFQSAHPDLQRAFLTHGFALACERAHDRAFVSVLRQRDRVVGFFPFQFASNWHRHAMLAERMGGALSDNAGLVAAAGFHIEPSLLMRLSRLGSAFVTHLADGQAAFGLAARDFRPGHEIDLAGGGETIGALAEARRKRLNGLRRLEREFGALEFHADTAPDPEAVLDVIASKRAQYARTGVADPFNNPASLRLIRLLAAQPNPDCQPVLHRLSAGGRCLARHFGLIHASTLSYWFPVYDGAARRGSPGQMLLWHIIQLAAAHGIRLIDLGEGDTKSKRDFSTGMRRYGRVLWHDGGWRSLVSRAWQSAAWQRDGRSRAA